jgi:hypothetical protein
MRSQMKRAKSWILPKEINVNRILLRFSLAGNLVKNHLCPTMGSNGGSVSMDSVSIHTVREKTRIGV